MRHQPCRKNNPLVPNMHIPVILTPGVQSTKVPREPIPATEKWRRNLFPHFQIADWSALHASVPSLLCAGNFSILATPLDGRCNITVATGCKPWCQILRTCYLNTMSRKESRVSHAGQQAMVLHSVILFHTFLMLLFWWMFVIIFGEEGVGHSPFIRTES